MIKITNVIFLNFDIMLNIKSLDFQSIFVLIKLMILNEIINQKSIGPIKSNVNTIFVISDQLIDLIPLCTGRRQCKLSRLNRL